MEFISQFWRLPGNHGYDVSIDWIRERLTAAGFAPGADGAAPHAWVDEYPNPGRSWEHSVGTVALIQNGKPDDIVLSREQERLALCINSFSTARRRSRRWWTSVPATRRRLCRQGR